VAAPAQLIYLVLFSYAFFFEGYTGLTITVASIVTLAALMHITAKVDWEARFQRPERQPHPPAPPPAPPPAQPPGG
jgi:inner membrane protein involved in colicin E2 resistance